MKEKLFQSQSLFNSENERHQQVVEKLQSCLNQIREQHRLEIEQILSKKRLEINELESEFEKQRERTTRLLNEKDRELETFRDQHTPPRQMIETNHRDPAPPPTTILNEFFPQTSSIGGPVPSSNSETTNNILYFVEEQQLKEQELVSLRKQRYDLEVTIRDLHRKYAYEIGEFQLTIERLQEELEEKKLTEKRYENLTKNEQNIDYIKNVFYHYLLATDHQVKQTMANALMTILHFSSKEKAKIESVRINHSLAPTSWFSKS